MWLEPETHEEFDIAVGAQVISVDQSKLGLVDDDGKVRECGSPP